MRLQFAYFKPQIVLKQVLKNIKSNQQCVYIYSYNIMQYNSDIQAFLSLSEEKKVKLLCMLFNEKRLKQFITYCEVLIKKGVSLDELSEKYKQKVQLNYQYESMKRVYNKTVELLEIAHKEDEGWKKLDVDQKCTLSLRLNGTMMQLKSKGVVKCSIKNLTTVIYLIKLYDQCLPFCKEALDICQPTRLQKVGMINLSFPVPFVKDRCSFVRGVGIDRTRENGTVCIFAQGINSNEQYLDHYKINIKDKMKKKQLLDVKSLGLQMTCIDENTTEYSGYVLVDHHLSIVPDKILMFIAKEFGTSIFRKLVKKLLDFDNSVWAKEMKDNYAQNGQFYDWIHKKCTQLVEKVKLKPKI